MWIRMCATLTCTQTHSHGQGVTPRLGQLFVVLVATGTELLDADVEAEFGLTLTVVGAQATVQLFPSFGEVQLAHLGDDAEAVVGHVEVGHTDALAPVRTLLVQPLDSTGHTLSHGA